MAYTLREDMKRFTPDMCRMLARKGPPHSLESMTDEEIAKRSGLSVAEVISISYLTNWDDVPMSKFLAFTKGCDIDFDDPKRMRLHRDYFNRKKRFKYLRKDENEWFSRWEKMRFRYVEARIGDEN